MSQEVRTIGSDNGDSRTPEINQTIDASISVQPSIPVSRELTTTLHPTWDEAVAGYLDAAIDSPNTRRAYSRHLRRAGETLGVDSLRDLTGADLASYRAAVTSSGLAASSQSQALSSLRSFLTWSGSMGGHSLPAQMVSVALRAPRVSVAARFNVITEKEISAMLDAARDPRERALAGVLLGGGLRVAEVAKLAVRDVVEALDGGVALFVDQGKGRKDRMVPIGGEVDALIRAYLASTGRYLGGEGPLFLANDRGSKTRAKAGLSTRAISRIVRELASAAGIAAKQVTPHALRHSYAMRCLRDHPAVCRSSVCERTASGCSSAASSGKWSPRSGLVDTGFWPANRARMTGGTTSAM